MNQVSQPDFVRAIARSQLLDRTTLEHRLDDYQCAVAKEERTASRLAQFLIKSGDLTKYQAERLLAGRSEGFFLGQCKILDRLGAGGMGSVYLAEQLKLGRQVALKVLSAKHAKDPEYLARFQREARAVAALKHPNVVQIYDVGQDGQTHYIIMELVRGTSLERRIEKEGPLSVDEALAVIEQVARGLQHAHEQVIIHRDIKPSNLVMEGTTVKILDLGLARKFESGTITQELKGMGTPDYMSPEQFNDAHKADARSDLYSLGCTWYHLLAGQPPFAKASPLGKGLSHLMETPAPLHTLEREVPSEVEALIGRLMAKKPEERYQSAGELLAAVEHCRDTSGEAVPVRRASARTAVPIQTPDSRSEQSLPDVSLVPAVTRNSESLIRTPSTSIPTLLLYLLPIMAALVLGGIYLGIRLFREQFERTEPLLVDVTPSVVSQAAPGSGNQPPTTASPKAQEKPLPEVGTKPPHTAPANVVPQPPPEPPKTETVPTVPEKWPPKVWVVGAGADSCPAVESAWNQAGHGDRIELASPGPHHVGALRSKGERLVIKGTAKERPILLCDLPAEPQSGRGLWQIEGGSLTLEGVDVYIDLRKRTVNDTELVLVELRAADFRLVDASITVVRGAVQGRSPVTAIKVQGERPWDNKAKGNAPPPVRVELLNSLVRGTQTAIYLDSRQADVFLENSMLSSPGSGMLVFHTRSFELAHHAINLEIGSCTLDLDGPVASIECRPFQLTPVPVKIKLASSFLVSSVQGKTRPAQVRWQSPVADPVLSTGLRWTAKNNHYFQRGEGLQSKSLAGPVNIFVEKPADWLRLDLGEEAGAVELTQNVSMPRGPYDRRTAGDYLFQLRPGAVRPALFGADPKRTVSPRRIPGL